jgi:hypothetical protein
MPTAKPRDIARSRRKMASERDPRPNKGRKRLPSNIPETWCEPTSSDIRPEIFRTFIDMVAVAIEI